MAKGSGNEEIELLSIFPEELWDVILAKVTEAPNYHSISSASFLFRNLLRPYVQKILFSEVLSVLLEQQPADWSRRKDSVAKKNVPRSEVHVLTLHAVCRPSRNAVDGWLQAQEFYPNNKYERCLEWVPAFGIGYKRIFARYRELRQFAEFQQHFGITHLEVANPFLSRGIILQFTTLLENLDVYYDMCTQILQQYGEHLWYCQIEIAIHQPRKSAEFYTGRLQAILELMPNLRALMFISTRQHVGNVRDNEITFPRLEQLRTLGLWGLPHRVTKTMFQKNPQVTKLEVRGSLHLLKLGLELLPSLTDASFTMWNEDEGMFEVLQSAQLASRVERLWLDASDMKGVPWERIFRAVESQFSGSLTQLHLGLPKVFENDLEIHQGLTIPNLKKLEIVTYDAFLDFVLSVKETLEKLSVEYREESTMGCQYNYRRPQPKKEKGIIKLYSCWENPIRSTIWNHFARLTLLETRTYKWGFPNIHTCTRDQWEANERQKTAMKEIEFEMSALVIADN